MIKIKRPANVPEKLTKDGVAETNKNIAAYNLAPATYVAGTAKFEILTKIYGHRAVKSVLKAAQHNKCCFCEKDHVEEYGAVEHFRPKAGYKSDRKENLKKPGYYWLAYDWDNLLYVCGYCNSAKHKGNLFPLVIEGDRATSHNDDISNEDPYLINPAVIAPDAHIFFVDELIYGKTVYGNKTIGICGLDRESLNNKRKEHIDNLNTRLVLITTSADTNSAVVKKAKEYLKRATLPTAEFSATAIAYLSQFNIQ